MTSGLSDKMTEWERLNDASYWRQCLEKALCEQDTQEIQELVHEGVVSDYSFTPFWDEPVVCKWLDYYSA